MTKRDIYVYLELSRENLTTPRAWIEFALQKRLVPSKLVRFLVMRLHLDVGGECKVALQCVHCILQHLVVDSMVYSVEEANVATRSADLGRQLFSISETVRVYALEIYLGERGKCGFCRCAFEDAAATRDSAVVVMDPCFGFRGSGSCGRHVIFLASNGSAASCLWRNVQSIWHARRAAALPRCRHNHPLP